jgi:6-phosphogluconolactonase (cycloisomerase 2 family)
VSAYAIDPASGALTPVPGSPFGAGAVPGSIALAPSGRFVYVANHFSHDVSAYSVEPSGGLKPIRGSPFPTEQFPMAVTVASTGRFLYVVSGGSPRPSRDGHGWVSAYAIGERTGALSPVTGSPVPAGAAPGSVAAAPSGKFVYVTSRREERIRPWHLEGSRRGSGARGIRASWVGTGAVRRAPSANSDRLLARAAAEGMRTDQGARPLTPLHPEARLAPLFS